MSEKYTLGEASAIGGIAAVVLSLITVLGSVLGIIIQVAYTWVDLHLYNWFFVPYLHTPVLGLLPAVGIVTLWNIMTISAIQPNIKAEYLDDKKNKLQWTVVPIMHLAAWGMGAILHWMIGKGW